MFPPKEFPLYYSFLTFQYPYICCNVDKSSKVFRENVNWKYLKQGYVIEAIYTPLGSKYIIIWVLKTPPQLMNKTIEWLIDFLVIPDDSILYNTMLQPQNEQPIITIILYLYYSRTTRQKINISKVLWININLENSLACKSTKIDKDK